MTRARSLSRLLHALPLLGLIAALTSCADLAAVRDFARTSSEAASFEALVEDYIDGPARLNAIRGQDAPDRVEARLAQREDLLTLQDAVADYMHLLGQLAGEEGTAVENARSTKQRRRQRRRPQPEGERRRESMSPEASSEAESLFQLVNDAILQHWREAEIVLLLERGGPSFDVIIHSMRNDLLPAFELDLELERSALRSRHRAHLERLDNAENLDEATRSAIVELLGERHRKQLAEVAAHRRAIADYSDVLDSIRAGHERLQGTRNFTAEALVAELRDRSRSIREGLDDLRNFRRSPASSPAPTPNPGR